MLARKSQAALDQAKTTAKVLTASDAEPKFAKKQLAVVAGQFENVTHVVEALRPEEPIFCLRLSELRRAARRFAAFPGRPLYAVKCNPDSVVTKTLFDTGICDFDVASLEEVMFIDRLFSGAAGQFFNNPAKSRSAIRIASSNYGVRFFTADTLEEVQKILEEAATRSDVVIAVRISTASKNARYLLSTKFGAQPAEAVRMLDYAHGAGVKVGISFHVGSQCLSPDAFYAALKLVGQISTKTRAPISVLNVGGGFPAPYPGDDVPELEHYFSAILEAKRSLKLSAGCLLVCEPGRSLVAASGTVILQVVVRREDAIFVNDGVFGTLHELVHPKERRPVTLHRPRGTPSALLRPFKVFGPTCDSNDVLGAPFLLPEDVREGDWIEVGMMGAYSLAMRTQFNGFHTSKMVYLGEV
jgi:ornithine decarboxylase